MAELRVIRPDFFVAPQLELADFAVAKERGIKTVINNRPDGEAPDQLSGADAQAAALAQGLAYIHIPVALGGLTAGHVDAFRAAVAEHDGPFLAYCRSGTRSCHLWALSSPAHIPVEEVVKSAEAAGYDITPLIPALRASRAD